MIVPVPYRVCEADQCVYKLEARDKGPESVIRGVGGRWVGERAIFLVRRGIRRPDAAIAGIFEKTTMTVVFIMKLVKDCMQRPAASRSPDGDEASINSR